MASILLPSLYIAAYGQTDGNRAFSDASFSDIQLKATHNSYRLPDPPSVQIIDYNVWEIELDFGVLTDSTEFIVGHDGPEPRNGLRSLEDWVLDIKRGMTTIAHPIILKLEAKTRDRSGPFTDRKWLPASQWGKWQARLRNYLIALIDEENWITRRVFRDDYSSVWPSVSELAGKYIITLQDNNGDKDIDTTSDWFFPDSIPGLRAWPAEHPIHSAAQFAKSVMSGVNRVIMDEGYREPWSNLFVHPPVPGYVCTSATGPQWGTTAYPFHSVEQALNAYWTISGRPLAGGVIILPNTDSASDSEYDRILIRHGMTDAVLAGSRCAYMIVFRLRDTENASTNDSIWYEIEGERGKTAETLFSSLSLHAGKGEFGVSWYESDDLGTLKSVTIRIAGDDDAAFDKIIVTSSTSGRYIGAVSGWIGSDHVNPANIVLILAREY